MILVLCTVHGNVTVEVNLIYIQLRINLIHFINIWLIRNQLLFNNFALLLFLYYFIPNILTLVHQFALRRARWVYVVHLLQRYQLIVNLRSVLISSSLSVNLVDFTEILSVLLGGLAMCLLGGRFFIIFVHHLIIIIKFLIFVYAIRC